MRYYCTYIFHNGTKKFEIDHFNMNRKKQKICYNCSIAQKNTLENIDLDNKQHKKMNHGKIFTSQKKYKATAKFVVAATVLSL